MKKTYNLKSVLKESFKKSMALLSAAAVCATVIMPVTFADADENSTSTANTVEKYETIASWTSGYGWLDSNSASDRGYNYITAHINDCAEQSTPANDFESGYGNKAKIHNRKSAVEDGQVKEQGNFLIDNMDLGTATKYSVSFDIKVLKNEYLSDGADSDRAFQIHLQDSSGKYVGFLRLHDGYIALSKEAYWIGRYTTDGSDRKVVPYTTNKWQHVEYMVDTQSRDIEWYINGKLVAGDKLADTVSESAVLSKIILQYGDSNKGNDDFLELDNLVVAKVTQESVSALDKAKQLLYNDYEDETTWNQYLKGYLNFAESTKGNLASRITDSDSLHNSVANIKNDSSIEIDNSANNPNYGMMYFIGWRHETQGDETTTYSHDFADEYAISFDIKIPNDARTLWARGYTYTDAGAFIGEQGFGGFLFDGDGYFGVGSDWFSAATSTKATAAQGKSKYKENDWNAVDMVVSKKDKTIAFYLNGGLVKKVKLGDDYAKTMILMLFKIYGNTTTSGVNIDNLRVLNLATDSFWYNAEIVGNDIVLDFNQQLVNQDLDAIKVTDEKGNTVGIASAKQNGHKIVLTPANILDYYTIEMPEHTMGSGGYLLYERTATVKKPRFKFEMSLKAGGNEIEQGTIGSLEANSEITLDVTCENTTEEAKKLMLIVGAYDSNGSLTEVSAKEVTATAETDMVTFDELPSLNLPEGTKELRAFAWLSNDYTPISDVIKINNTKTTAYTISDTTVKQLGRYATAVAGGRTYNWPGSGIEFKFNGTEAAINITEVTGAYNETSDTIATAVTDDDAPYFTVEVDGEYIGRVAVKNTGKLVLAENLAKGEHTIKFTRSGEATRGKLAADKIYVTSDSDNSTPVPTAAKTRKIEFYGDSYTVGYGNLYDSIGNAWATGKNTDFYNSYAAITARAFDADVNVIARSGKGIVKNVDTEDTTTNMTNQLKFADLKITTTEETTEWDFTKYIPDVVVTFLGTNDSAASVSDDEFVQGYLGFLTSIINKYGEENCTNMKFIVLTKPDLYTNAISDLKEELGWSNDGDGNIYFKTFSTFYSDCLGHPGAENHKKLAKEMAEFIKGATGWDYSSIS